MLFAAMEIFQVSRLPSAIRSYRRRKFPGGTLMPVARSGLGAAMGGGMTPRARTSPEN